MNPEKWKPAKIEDIPHPFAKTTYYAIQEYEYSTLKGVYQEEETSYFYIVYTQKVELGQHPLNDVQPTEEIAIQFDVSDVSSMPVVYLLRKDFTIVSHLNLYGGEFLSPCLYDIPPQDQYLQWNAISFIIRIKEWLSFTADGTLHQPDQPLEPYISTPHGHIVIPSNFNPEKNYFLSGKKSERGQIVFFLEDHIQQQPVPFEVLFLKTSVQEQGIIRYAPQNMHELFLLLAEAGIKLLDYLIPLFKDSTKWPNMVVIYLTIPLTHTFGQKNHEHSGYAFLSLNSIEEIGLAIDYLGAVEMDGKRNVSQLIGSPLNVDGLKSITIGALNPIAQFSKSLARVSNGKEEAFNKKITQIGLGALGSQIARNCAQSGMGIGWKFIDHDALLPHNLSRWAFPLRVGDNKAKAVSCIVNTMLSDYSFSQAYDYEFRLGSNDEEIENVIKDSDLIIDTSASVKVQRLLETINTPNQIRIAAFFSPSGKDLVLFKNDPIEGITLTMIEMVYYKHLLHCEKLNDHLSVKPGQFNYSISCRSQSSRHSTHYVSLLAAIASGKIEDLYFSSGPFGNIWSIQSDFSVSSNPIPILGFTKHKNDKNICVYVYEELLEKISQARSKALPNETGGILVGSYDSIFKTIFIVDQIASPTDSIEYPTSFLRGKEGVFTKLEQIRAKTLGNLYYIGEWHSHPDGSKTNPSSDDQVLIDWLKNESKTSVFPYLMLIMGEKSFDIYF